ncbi:hypothetical protein JTB14_017880 [Gonioctena quinquepunctata]|nr:hypothetical protein JTB14_017880 [Gonioctena quinquepunctata]
MSVTSSLKYDMLALSIAFIVIFFAWYRRALNYWKRKGIDGPTPSFPFGNMKDVFLQKKSPGEFLRDIYFDMKAKGLPHGGAYGFVKPQYIPADLNLIKAILHSDFQYFNSHGTYLNERTDPLSAHLVNFEGAKWKRIRNKLSPTFTSGKIKMMFQTMLNCTNILEENLEKSDKMNPVDIKDIMARFTTDMIGSCAFGLEINSMRDKDSDFVKYGKRVFDMSLFDAMKQLAGLFIPHSILGLFNYSMFNRESINFFHDIVKDIVEYREKNNFHRKDFLQLMIELKDRRTVDESADERDTESEGLSMNEIAAQSFIFFLGGYETASTTISFASYELAMSPDIQKKVRNEIHEVLRKYNNEITYEGVMEMHYLEKVINETLRKYPPLQILGRKCLQNYKVPGTDNEIEAGTFVLIPVLGVHYDSEYYPDPHKFDPERFNDEAKSSRPHYTWLPFGDGPRVCLGQRFGIIKTKLGLITLLKDYVITLNKRTRTPLVLKKLGFLSIAEDGVWVNLEKVA